eukprot:scaffold120755_cov40-Prasinocladus_malaysianus.AAC.2
MEKVAGSPVGMEHVFAKLQPSEQKEVLGAELLRLGLGVAIEHVQLGRRGHQPEHGGVVVAAWVGVYPVADRLALPAGRSFGLEQHVAAVWPHFALCDDCSCVDDDLDCLGAWVGYRDWGPVQPTLLLGQRISPDIHETFFGRREATEDVDVVVVLDGGGAVPDVRGVTFDVDGPPGRAGCHELERLVFLALQVVAKTVNALQAHIDGVIAGCRGSIFDGVGAVAVVVNLQRQRDDVWACKEGAFRIHAQARPGEENSELVASTGPLASKHVLSVDLERRLKAGNGVVKADDHRLPGAGGGVRVDSNVQREAGHHRALELDAQTHRPALWRSVEALERAGACALSGGLEATLVPEAEGKSGGYACDGRHQAVADKAGGYARGEVDHAVVGGRVHVRPDRVELAGGRHRVAD